VRSKNLREITILHNPSHEANISKRIPIPVRYELRNPIEVEPDYTELFTDITISPTTPCPFI